MPVRFMTEGPINEVQFYFNGTIAVAVGDLMYMEVDDVRPLSSQADQLTEYDNMARAAPLFVGVSRDARTINETAVVLNHPVATDVEVEIPCASDTYEVGDMVGPIEYVSGANAGIALENQKVQKTTDESLSIGYATRRYGSATTTVRCRLISRVCGHSPVGRNDPSIIEISYGLHLHASKVIYNILLAREALRVLSMDYTPDIAQGGALTATIVKATGTATPASATTPMHIAGAIDLNGAAHTRQSIALTATPADLVLAAGDRIGVVLSGAMTVGSGNVSIRCKRL